MKYKREELNKSYKSKNKGNKRGSSIKNKDFEYNVEDYNYDNEQA